MYGYGYGYVRVTRMVTPLLLDLYQGAAAAYSLRKLRHDYTGAAIRVRESSGNTEADIGFTSSGVLDTTALLAHTGANDGFVTTWYDQSGNARNATQATAANQPQIVSSGSVILENGKPALNSTSDSLVYNAVTDDVSYTAFVVIKYNSTALTQVCAGFDKLDLAMVSSNFQLSDSDVKTITSYTAADVGIVQRLHTGIAAVSGGNVTGTLFLNGVQKSTATTTLTSTRNGFSLFGNTTGSLRMNGTGQEFIFFPSNQSANRTAIESNINSHYNIY